jgi:hypothetical protein
VAKLYLPDSGPEPRSDFVYVLSSALDEANASPKGWASLHDLEVMPVAPWRVIWEIDTDTNTSRPVALIGYRRRTLGDQLMKEVVKAVTATPRREDKLYRLSDLVTSEEIAAMMRVSIDTVWQWTHRRKATTFPVPATPQFPLPLIDRPRVWDRREIIDWAHATGRVIHNRRIGSARKGGPRKAVKDPRSIRKSTRPQVHRAGV